jgi:hypothetical protein
MDEVLRSAAALIEQHGKDAAQVADKRAENAQLGDAPAAAHVWRQIAAAIRKLKNSR